MGRVRMTAAEIPRGNGSSNHGDSTVLLNSKKAKKCAASGGGEMGGFVLWQKKPDLWCLEIMVSGYKMSAGSDGKVAWRQTPWHNSHASRGPPRPLRRLLQGLDPRSTANLFSSSVCLGERTVNGHDCFVLRLEAEPSTLRSRCTSNVEIIRHTVWGCFSQRTGLLVQLEDSHLLRIRSPSDEGVYWETTMESTIEDYRTVEGVNIGHSGRTTTTLFRFGESSDKHTRTRMEEAWTVEEVDFNVWGLSLDCFLPPAELKDEKEVAAEVTTEKRRVGGRMLPALRVQQVLPSAAVGRIGPSQVVAIEIEEEG